MKRKIKTLFFGGISPVVGALIFLLQLQINPHGLLSYMTIQSVMTIIFLLYFFVCAYLFSSKQNSKTNIIYFFAVPFLLVIFNLVFRKVVKVNTVLSVVLSGLAAPFHHVLPYLYFTADKYFLLPTILPFISCWFTFRIGEKVSVYHKKERI